MTTPLVRKIIDIESLAITIKPVGCYLQATITLACDDEGVTSVRAGGSWAYKSLYDIRVIPVGDILVELAAQIENYVARARAYGLTETV